MPPTRQPRIYVAGHRGMVGAAIVRALQAKGCVNLVTRTHAELDLTNQAAVHAFFQSERIDQVYLAAAKVGGIHANSTYPAEFIYENLAIQTNVIHEAWRAGVQQLLFLGSSCIYPRDCLQPIKEEYLLTGPLEPTNEPYAIAKIAGIKMCESYNRQYGTDYRCVMPCNLYGPGDNYHPTNSHVVPALIRRIFTAQILGEPSVEIWGTGTPMREFLYVDDLAGACLRLMGIGAIKLQTHCPTPNIVNIGSGSELAIARLAELISNYLNYHGFLRFNANKPDGVAGKLLDISLLRALLPEWQPIQFEDGLKRTIDELERNSVFGLLTAV